MVAQSSMVSTPIFKSSGRFMEGSIWEWKLAEFGLNAPGPVVFLKGLE
ncbi:MAG: hypothetical protein KGI38_11375 [Thaumarchaeota archaeon]|nr:hypothetical protein [Nitrososphaerota archaeon]